MEIEFDLQLNNYTSTHSGSKRLFSTYDPSNSPLKLWKCPICNRRYSRKGDLKFQCVRKHPTRGNNYPEVVKSRSSKCNKPYQCPLDSCSSGDIRKSDLKNHFVMK